LAVGFRNGWLRTASHPASSNALEVRAAATAADSTAGTRPVATPDRATSGAAEDVAAYQQKLDEAYRALEDAYAQIQVLQSPSSQLASIDGRRRGHAHEDGHHSNRERPFDHDRDDD
jgi:hypothetical protein